MPRIKKTYTHNGITKTIAEWSRISGIEYNALNMRIKLGVAPEIIFDKEIPKRKPKFIKQRPRTDRSKHDTLWTDLACECYEIGCNCMLCSSIADDIKKYCKMKHKVIELVRLYGKPERGKDDR